ncbi:NAD(P)-dependent oxidoreductase [Glycomyces salinus]|uniref:NAD(P)-dependent oxidoreductase n=1 Tax=Glycomyces salinus TaxID=980294 RepID=UPI0018EAE1B8|nr:NAD(P)H-binding protein [Glycomyces salinus]
MKLAVIAATGATGRLVLSQALEAGHGATAVVRNPAKLSPGVEAVKVDLARPEPAALEAAVAGCDAVVSALGPTSKSELGVAAGGTAALIAAMRTGGVRRLVVLSAAPVGTVPTAARPDKPRHEAGEGPFMRAAVAVVKRVLRDHYADLAAMEDAVMDSGLDWTIVRPPQLTDGPFTGRYRTAYGRIPRRALRVSRADLAHCMLAQVGAERAVGRTVGVAA